MSKQDFKQKVKPILKFFSTAAKKFKNVDKFIQKLEWKIGDDETRKDVATGLSVGGTGLNFLLSLYDSFLKALKIEKISEKLHKNPNAIINNLDGNISLAFRIYQFILSALKTLVLGGLFVAGLIIAFSPVGSVPATVMLATYLATALLGLSFTISFNNFQKTLLKIFGLGQEEKIVKTFFEAHDVNFEDFIQFLRNSSNSIENNMNFHIQLNNQQEISQIELKQLFDQRKKYQELKKDLMKAGINPISAISLKEGEALPQSLQEQLQKLKGKITEETLRDFSRTAATYWENKAALQEKLGSELDLKALIQHVEDRRDKLNAKLFKKGIIFALAGMALLVGLLTATPLLTYISSTVIGVLWAIKLIVPFVWKQQAKQDMIIQEELGTKCNDGQSLTYGTALQFMAANEITTDKPFTCPPEESVINPPYVPPTFFEEKKVHPTNPTPECPQNGEPPQGTKP